MKAPRATTHPEVARFRTRLLLAMMLVVTAVTIAALYVARRNIAAQEEKNRQREFRAALTTLHNVQQLRHAALVERCRALARRSRIHAALEDGALDLLYPSARDELRDVLATRRTAPQEEGAYTLHARFYRFLDSAGRLIPSLPDDYTGLLQSDEEAQVALPAAPSRPQIGYLASTPAQSGDSEAPSVVELIATPIVSNETGEIIAALVLGFPAVQLQSESPDSGFLSGIWVHDRLHLPAVDERAHAALSGELRRTFTSAAGTEGSLRIPLGGEPHLAFYKQLNPDSLYPPAYEICVFPLTEMIARQRRLGWQIVGAGAVLILGGFGASHVLSGRFTVPVEKLAHDSEENRTKRERAEAELKSTSAELQRAARFSADASHQLKTPVTVLRAGLEELLARGHLMPAQTEEISTLIHQTYRLSSVIEDLLLLSRMDAGQLKISFGPVNLSQLIEAAIDDLGALPDDLHLSVETDFPPALHIAGEKRYTTIILQNLLENARKYNHPDGRIRISAREDDAYVCLRVANTSRRPISAEAQAHIFERFHRGSVGENIPGYGLGLNLAHELARIHDGDLRLVRSDETWTEFEVRFRPARALAGDQPALS